MQVFGKSQRVEVKIDRRAVEHAQHDGFAELRRQRGHAEVNRAVGHVITDATVLRQPPLGNVQVRHDFDARNHRQRQVLRRRRHFVKRAVHAVTDAKFVFKRFEMNVARAVLDGLKQDQVHELHDGRLVGQTFGLFGVIQRARLDDGALHFLVGTEFLEDLRNIPGFLLAVATVKRLFNFGGIGHDYLHVAFAGKTDFIRVRRIERIGQRDLQHPMVQRHRHAMIHPRDIDWNHFQKVRRKFMVAQGNDLRAQIAGHHMQDVVGLHDPEILQELEHRRAAALEFGGDFLVLQVVDQPLVFDEGQQWV